MKGILVINAFWKSASMNEMTAQLCAAAARLGMELTVRTNADLLCILPPLSPLTHRLFVRIMRRRNVINWLGNLNSITTWRKDLCIWQRKTSIG